MVTKTKTPNLCAICNKPCPIGAGGRPRKTCSKECRRERGRMAARQYFDPRRKRGNE